MTRWRARRLVGYRRGTEVIAIYRSTISEWEDLAARVSACPSRVGRARSGVDIQICIVSGIIAAMVTELAT